jgi:hypothetical protein
VKFYLFLQNNSGGSFRKDDNGNINLIVQARSETEANLIAENDGFVYFDGVAKGEDCDCCGDRWHKVSDGRDDMKVLPDDIGDARVIYLTPVMQEME